MGENRRVKGRVAIVGLVICLVTSLIFALRLWSWVLNFDPGFAFTHTPVPTGPPLTASVTVLLVDGLRLDASRRMPTLNDLRHRGADVDAYVGTPSFSRPGRATIAVGAFPSVHGVTTNRGTRALTIDNIIRRVGGVGGTCRVAGSTIWSSLFSADIAKCGIYRETESKEGPGAFVRQIGAVRASRLAGMSFIFEQTANLRVLDSVATDFAAHEYGGVSPQYLEEVARTDVFLAELLKHLDLEKETLLVTSDHGHRDEGGHGGEEPDVLAIPIVMAGAGIKPGSVASASQADIAPTIAALLGTALPAGSFGAPIESVLLGDDSKRVMVKGASVVQKDAFDNAIGERLGVPMASRASRSAHDLTREYRERDTRGRLPRVALILVALILFVWISARSAACDRRALGVSAIVAAIAFVLMLAGPPSIRLPPLSFSAINYDETLVPYFRRILMTVAGAALASIVGGLIAAYFLRPKEGRASSMLAQAATTGLVLAAFPAAATAILWCRDDLLSPFTLPGSDRMVIAYAVTLSVATAASVALVVVALFWALSKARWPSREAML